MVTIKELLPHIENYLIAIVNTRFVDEQEFLLPLDLCANDTPIVWQLLIHSAIDNPCPLSGALFLVPF